MTYGQRLEMFKINGKPSDAEYFKKDIEFMANRSEGGISNIIELDYVENPEMDYEDNKYHMSANVFKQSRFYLQSYEIDKLSTEDFPDNYPELNNRNFTLFLVERFDYCLLIMFFDGTVFSKSNRNDEITVLFKTGPFKKMNLNEFEEHLNGGYYHSLLNLLHEIYNDKEKEQEIFNKIKQIITK